MSGGIAPHERSLSSPIALPVTNLNQCSPNLTDMSTRLADLPLGSVSTVGPVAGRHGISVQRPSSLQVGCESFFSIVDIEFIVL